MTNIRIGSVPYLNEKPLTRWFHATEEGRQSGYTVTYDHPSRLAVQLANGDIAAALVSSFEYFRTPGYAIVPGVSISGQDDILSVRAFSRLPWRQLESVALDTSSLTSAALLKIILAEQWQSFPTFLSHEPDLDTMLQHADGALLIGDKGMLADTTGLRDLDLGHAWRRLTGMPFVYAVWLARPADATSELAGALEVAKQWGKTQLETIAHEEAQRLHCSQELCHRYLSEIMDYDLGDEHMTALAEFGRKAKALGLLSNYPAHAEL